MSDFKDLIRDVPDFPKPGILFKDITPVLGDPEAFGQVIDRLADLVKDRKIDKVAGMEARGFIFGSVLALRLGVGFIPVRKKGKLPAASVSVTYDLEYGTDTLEMHEDALAEGETVLVVDDLLATGGTAAATGELIAKAGGKVDSYLFVIELDFLEGRKKLGGEVHSLVHV
ncbi:MAG: adenine phosphoribosyltransferase [Deltaproteobacteria bacterium]|nr:adenine phosphoribosyltransferase [Deltaproteobacteria bacterium]